MGDDWSQHRLSDLVEIKHGYAFAGEHFADHPTSSVLLTPGNFRIGGGYKGEKTKYYDGPVPADYVLPPRSLVVTMTDLSKNMDTLGYPAWSPDLGGVTVLHNQRLGLVEAISDEVDLRFIYYLMCSRDYRNEVLASSTGTTVHHTSPGRILSFAAEFPPLAQQRRIAATLGALDDKTESNRRAIDVAEALAAALFARHAETKVELASVAEVVMGSSPPGTSYNGAGEGTPFYQGVRDFGRRYPTHRVWTTQPVRLAHYNDTLVSVRAPVGDLNRATEECCIGRGLAAVCSQAPSAVFYALRGADDVWEPFQHEGTVFGAINKGDLAKTQISWPNEKHLANLEADLEAIDEEIRCLDAETLRLTDLRNVLLPEFLSGRIGAPERNNLMQENVA